MRTEEELLENYIEECDKYDKVFSEAPIDMNYEEFTKYMSDAYKSVALASRNYRLIQTPKFKTEKDTIGNKMLLKDFIENCECGGFIDYDGFGYYSKDGFASDIEIYPSDIDNNSIRKDFDEIIWYNR